MNRGDTAAARPSVLVVDDDLYLLAAIKQTLTLNGYAATTCGNPLEALARLGDQPFAAVLADIRMPEMNGMVLLERILERDPDLPVILITGHGDISLAVEAVKKGAYHFLQKPVDEDIILATLARAIERRQLVLENRRLEEQLTRTRETRSRFYGLVGSHPSMLELYRLIETIAHETASVLIIGESGTGKELVAQTLHHLSPRAQAPYVAINCAAIPETLLESEIFGHEKGAFTGAYERRAGCFELADRGTLFLDEIAEMVPATQVKLLRVLQERRFRRLGGRNEQDVDVRVIAATNVDPATAVKSGKLREDLYYRLNVFTIALPPLRDRKEDLPLLVQTFVEEFNQRDQKAVKAVDPEAMRRLEAYHWPGNVRELRNVIERAVILAKGDFIETKHLPPLSSDRRAAVAASAPGSEVMLTPGMTVDEAEQKLILATLDAASGNKTRAAEMLGISLKTLHNKLNRMKQGA